MNDLKSVYSFNTIQSIEGNNNYYSIYRAFDTVLNRVVKADRTTIFSTAKSDTSTGTNYNRYDVKHLEIINAYDDLKDAKMEDTTASKTADLAAYESPAKAVLMLDTPTNANPDSTTTEPADTADPCKKKIDLTISKIWKTSPTLTANARIVLRSKYTSRSLKRTARPVKVKPCMQPLR